MAKKIIKSKCEKLTKVTPKSQKLTSKSRLGGVSRRLGGFRMSVEAKTRDLGRQKQAKVRQGDAQKGPDPLVMALVASRRGSPR